MKRGVTALLGAAALAVMLAACERGERGEPERAEPAAEFRPPGPEFVADIERGNQLFHANCAVCHGQGAMGTRRGPPLVHKVYEPSHHSDVAFYLAVRDGVRAHHWNFGNMPPIRGLSGEDTAHIIAYIRAEQRKAGIF